ncbi:hypothetical protein SipoB123_29420 [Streptomyces ipomoeae]|nr:hypothetical protein SipoB123_29420 [Streptomyces ipomoeae]
MPELLEDRTTDPATWMRTPENLNRYAALTREADARRRHRRPGAERPGHRLGKPAAAERDHRGSEPPDQPGAAGP